EDRVICLVVDGEPNASAQPGCTEPECMPEAVRYWVNHEGKITEIPTEPIAADARRSKDGKKNALLKLIAGVLGVNFDDLKRRDYERRERSVKVALTGVFVALLIFSVMGVAFYFQKNEAINSQKVAERERLFAESARDRALRAQAVAEK